MRTTNRRRNGASRNKAHVDLDAYVEKKMQDPEFRAAYEAEDKRIDLILQIIRLRQQRGMTQADLARAIGTKQANVSRLERLDYNFTLEMLERIAAALGAQLEIALSPKKAKAA
ncbi:MAG TPA: helix-turn-helix transcriptional regulator [Candidatus Acidoferrales bacterium]|nr:helix-turn-helix transcriptional regulator [Candidatus Acidoferrales bacterium]